MSYEMIALLMFAGMMLMLLTGQRVFAAIGFVAAGVSLLLYGQGAVEMPFNAAFKLFNWFPMLTLPLFIYMGYVLAEAGIAEDLYRMFHVWFGRVRGGLAIGTLLLMVVVSAMNGLSVAGMAIGATIALPEMLRRGYDKVLISGVVQGGSSLGILVPPSVVMVLYGMIARQPVSQLWLAGVLPGLLMAALFATCSAISGSSRVAAIASVVYAAHPAFLFQGAQFSYEALALPLALLGVDPRLASQQRIQARELLLIQKGLHWPTSPR